MLIERIRATATRGVVIPKPMAKGKFMVKGWGKRRGEPALIYTIPNHKNPSIPYAKGVTVNELEMAFAQLSSAGGFTRTWFNVNLPMCAKEGGCNFTSIGGIFVLLGLARYSGKGVYERV